MSESELRQAVQSAVADVANTQNTINTIGVCLGVAGTMCIALFFIIDARIDTKTNGAHIDIAVMKAEFRGVTREVGSLRGEIGSMDRKLDKLLLLKK